jgi:hypothetical protein
MNNTEGKLSPTHSEPLSKLATNMTRLKVVNNTFERALNNKEAIEFIGNINGQKVNLKEATLKNAYNALIHSDHLDILTPKQKHWTNEHNIQWNNRVWKNNTKLECRNKIQCFHRLLCNNALPIPSGPLKQNCSHCNVPENSFHTQWECPRSQNIIKKGQEIWRTWTHESLQLTFKNLLELHAESNRPVLLRNFLAILLWTIWICRNEEKFNGKKYSDIWTKNFIELEIRRLIRKVWYKTANSPIISWEVKAKAFNDMWGINGFWTVVNTSLTINI